MNRKTLISVTALTAALSTAMSAFAQEGARAARGDESDTIAVPIPGGNGGVVIVPSDSDKTAPRPLPAPIPEPLPVPPGEGDYCKSDMNKDKKVTYSDLFAFLEMYFAGQKEADMNADGHLGSSDIFEYIAHFVVGC